MGGDGGCARGRCKPLFVYLSLCDELLLEYLQSEDFSTHHRSAPGANHVHAMAGTAAVQVVDPSSLKAFRFQHLIWKRLSETTFAFKIELMACFLCELAPLRRGARPAVRRCKLTLA